MFFTPNSKIIVQDAIATASKIVVSTQSTPLYNAANNYTSLQANMFSRLGVVPTHCWSCGK